MKVSHISVADPTAPWLEVEDRITKAKLTCVVECNAEEGWVIVVDGEGERARFEGDYEILIRADAPQWVKDRWTTQ